MKWRILASVLALILNSPLTIRAQQPDVGANAANGRAVIAGTITNQAGAPIAYASVKMETGTGGWNSATTDAQGRYKMGNLRPGAYTFAVTANGARIFEQPLTLTPGENLSVNVDGQMLAKAATQSPQVATNHAVDNQGTSKATATLSSVDLPANNNPAPPVATQSASSQPAAPTPTAKETAAPATASQSGFDQPSAGQDASSQVATNQSGFDRSADSKPVAKAAAAAPTAAGESGFDQPVDKKPAAAEAPTQAASASDRSAAKPTDGSLAMATHPIPDRPPAAAPTVASQSQPVSGQPIAKQAASAQAVVNRTAATPATAAQTAPTKAVSNQPADSAQSQPAQQTAARPILPDMPEFPIVMPLAPPGAITASGPSVVGSGGSSISGAVNDQSGAVVVNATVTIKSSSGTPLTAVSDQKGNYAVRGLTPGAYTVTVTAPGFKKFEAASITIEAAQQLPLDAVLEPGGEKTEVNVEASKVAGVEVENAEVTGTVTEKEVLTLGLNGRNFTQLIALTPGVSNQTGQDEAKVGVTGSVKYSVNGGRVEYNTFEVDGSDVLNAGLNGAESTLVVYPSLDAIQEVKVLTSNYGAMYGRTASGTVMVTTKSGGQTWHGSGYEFLRNEAFNARNYFDQTPHRPMYRRNDFGYTLGGPLFIPNVYNTKKDKTFVFFSEEFRYEKSPTDLQPSFNRAVPSLAERQGDFSDVCPATELHGQVNFSRSQWPDCPSSSPGSAGLRTFPDNNIASVGLGNPFTVLDPNAVALLNTNLIPLPNSSTGCNSTIGSCYNSVISEPTYWREELFRIDHQITQNVRATARYIHDQWNTVTPVPQWGFVRNSFPTVQNKFVGPGTSAMFHLEQTISPTLLNQFTASYTNSNISLDNMPGVNGESFTRPEGLGTPGGACTQVPNGEASPVTSCPMGALFNNGFGGKAPGIVIGGNNLEYGGNGFTADTSYMPWQHTNPSFTYADNVSKVIKSHTLQFGAQLILSEKNETNGAIGAATGDTQGLLTFSNINAGVLNTGNAFANFLALSTLNNQNVIQSYTQDSQQYRYYNRYRIGEPYIQDDWKVNSRLTVNLGVRFSLFGLFHEKYLRSYNWDPSAYDPAVAAQLLVDPTTGQLLSRPDRNPIPNDPNNPDPRLLNGIVQCGLNNRAPGCMKNHLFNPAPRIGFAWDPWGDGKTAIRAGYGIFYEHGTGEESNTGSLEASAPTVLSMTERFPESYGCIGGSAGADGSCNTQPGAYPLNVTAIPNQAVWSYAQQWSFSVQRDLPHFMVASVAYVGSKGTHLTVERQINQLHPLPNQLNPFGIHEPLIPLSPFTNGGDCGGYSPPAGDGTPGQFALLNGTFVGPQDPAYINLSAACAGVGAVTKPPTPDANTLRPYPGFGQIFSLENGADSSYHAMQLTIRRTKGPLTLGGSYSYSHSIDDSSDRSDATFVNSYDLRTNKGSSNFDQRHLLSVSYIYDLPIGRLAQKVRDWAYANEDGSPSNVTFPGSDSGFIKKMLDGWQISGITVFQSGTPFSVINGGSGSISVLDNAGVANGIGAGSYPDLADSHDLAPVIGGTNDRSFGPLLANPNMFVAPRGLTFGDAGRNILNNPHRTNFDLSILKHYVIGEDRTLEFRAEAFNLFNHTQFRIYNPDLGNTGSNVISCYGGPNNSAGFSEVGGTDCITGNSFLHPVDAHRPRTIQLGLKLAF